MGKPRAARSLADQLADFEDPTPKDFDPEDIDNGQQSSDDEGEDQEEVNTGREHYQTVGRAALGAESDEDEDDEDSDISSGSEEFASGDDALAQESSDEDTEGGEDDDEEESEEDDEDESEDADEVVHKHSKKTRQDARHGDTTGPSGDRDEIRKLMATDQKTIAATISSAAKADATKGKAVKQQRTTFDALLNARMKLQSGLTSINGIAAVLGSKNEADGEDAMNDDEEVVDEEAIKSAESAALALWSTLEGLRTALADATAKEGSKKRKRPSPASPTTSSASLWERMAELESESISHRRSVLDKWSSKVRGTSASLPNARGKLLGSTSGRQQTITAVLDAQVATEIGERPSKRSRTSDQQEPLYDDGAFYQSLLRDLVEQRMSSTDSMTSGFDNLHQLPSRLPIHPITGMRNDKVKRDIDTRASKGRKMKYNVHEKLQNFMAPDDRGSWSTRARDEFFASLLGKTASGLLGEGDEGASDEEDDVDREEGGLRLFRN
ncbi:Apoptosis-antagonizing transcription factor C-terminal [Penicillium expansum]|nr:Apoptosis-antagonizing transcription factor C-terminal [Penicillium expansum]